MLARPNQMFRLESFQKKKLIEIFSKSFSKLPKTNDLEPIQEQILGPQKNGSNFEAFRREKEIIENNCL